jgi:hypothetical protein
VSTTPTTSVTSNAADNMRRDVDGERDELKEYLLILARRVSGNRAGPSSCGSTWCAMHAPIDPVRRFVVLNAAGEQVGEGSRLSHGAIDARLTVEVDGVRLGPERSRWENVEAAVSVLEVLGLRLHWLDPALGRPRADQKRRVHYRSSLPEFSWGLGEGAPAIPVQDGLVDSDWTDGATELPAAVAPDTPSPALRSVVPPAPVNVQLVADYVPDAESECQHVNARYEGAGDLVCSDCQELFGTVFPPVPEEAVEAVALLCKALITRRIGFTQLHVHRGEILITSRFDQLTFAVPRNLQTAEEADNAALAFDSNTCMLGLGAI